MGHGEAVNLEFNDIVLPGEIRETLRLAPGIVVVDEPEMMRYPTPLEVAGRDEVFVGRIRQDASLSHAADMWIVADNLHKGAATNAIQIALAMHHQGFLHPF
jgi:aspartate-semialdehyde dehydrogenase